MNNIEQGRNQANQYTTFTKHCQGVQNFSKSKPKPVTVPEAKPSEAEGVVVSVILSAEDHKHALAPARMSNQTLAEWISSMVNMTLLP
jgi:hypothetical protein